MNKATKTAAIFNSQANPFQLKASLFHSSPILERRRRTQWDFGRSASKGSSRLQVPSGARGASATTIIEKKRQLQVPSGIVEVRRRCLATTVIEKKRQRSNFYSRRYRKLNSRETLFENVNAFAEQFFQGWQPDRDEYDPSSSRDSSWFRRDFRASGNKGGRSRNKGPHQQRGFQFFEDNDMEIETFFRSAFGGNKYYYWSFMNEEPQWRNSSSYSNNYRWNQRYQYSDYDESTDSENSESDLSSLRVTLGLNASGPLNLEDVKNAYRLCALKWHPDRHQGSSKAVAEEKFKACSAAYQCLCDKLALT